MAIEIDETPNSREFTTGATPSGRRFYTVHGTLDDATVRALVAALAPAEWANLYRQNMTARPKAYDSWEVEVPYGPRKREQGQSEWSFSISTTMVHTTHSLETVAEYVPEGEDPEDFGQAINLVGEGDDEQIEGVDVPSADLTWQETLYLPIAQFTPAYFNLLYQTVAKANASAFRIFGEQEVLLDGISGGPAGDMVALTFQFKASESKTGLSIGDIAGIAKKGWEYLWVRSKASDGSLQPAQVNIEKVIETADYSALGIPDPFHGE